MLYTFKFNFHTSQSTVKLQRWYRWHFIIRQYLRCTVPEAKNKFTVTHRSTLGGKAEPAEENSAASRACSGSSGIHGGRAPPCGRSAPTTIIYIAPHGHGRHTLPKPSLHEH